MKKQEAIQKLEENDVFLTDGHVYKSISNPDHIFTSVTKLIERYDHEFDKYMISYNMASSQSLTKTREDIQIRQQKILQEWDDMGVKARNYGTIIHEAFEQYFKSLQTSHKLWEKIAGIIYNQMQYGRLIFVEKVLVDHEYSICGTVDRMVFATLRSEVPIIDLYDIKTNQNTTTREGIRFGSKNYMKSPMDHLPSCEYIRDALQLSIYSWILERKGFRIGELWIEHIIHPHQDPNYIPVPYMKYEAEMLVKANANEMSAIGANIDGDW